MTTLTQHSHAEPVTLHDHPIAKLVAAVRQRCDSRKLDFIAADKCLIAARKHYDKHGSLARAIVVGQRAADGFAGITDPHSLLDPAPGAA